MSAVHRMAGKMNLFDLLGQVQRVFQYTRSWGSLFTSLVIAAILTGTTFDFLYGSLYRRINNTSHTHYGLFYWLIFGVLCFLLPLSYALYRVISWALRLRPFKSDTLGIAVAQFEVWSGGAGQLSSTDRLNAMGQVVPTFFAALRSRLSDDPQWSASFSLKFLPPTLHVRNGQAAETLLASQNATLVVWGLLVQRSSGALQIELHLTGNDMQVVFTGPLDDISALDSSALFIKANSLAGAAFSAKRRQDYAAGIKFLQMALIPAAVLDKRADDAKEGLTNALVPTLQKLERLAAGLPEEPELQVAQTPEVAVARASADPSTPERSG